ncbi:hypothetical protein AMTRI_Chr07g24180 [Amborella trichopoda]
MEKTQLFEVRPEPEVPFVSKRGGGLFTFHLMVRSKLKTKQW